LPREDLLTPIHKGLRSLIYDTGRELQTTDFTDRTATEAVCSRFGSDFKSASSSCTFCWLSSHAGDENNFVFSRVQAEERELVRTLLEEHEEIEKMIMKISKMSEELKKTNDASQRLAEGERLNQKANGLFAYYITHMNKEEAKLVPSLQKNLTDDEMRAIRGAIIRKLPPDRVPFALRFVLGSLNLNELVDYIAGMKRDTPPQVFQGMTGMFEQTLGQEKWKIVNARIGE